VNKSKSVRILKTGYSYFKNQSSYFKNFLSYFKNM